MTLSPVSRSGNAELLELADRVETASAPDRELDRAIHIALFGGPILAAIGDNRSVETFRVWDADPVRGLSQPYFFTGSVEDAEKALPGLEWPEWQVTRRFCTGYHANIGLGEDGAGCETPALALLAAALRARVTNLIEASEK